MTCSNEELEAGSRIQVVVRVRPLLPHEVAEPVAVTCSQDGHKVQVALPKRESSKPAIAASSRPDAKAYGFDACLTGSTTQAQLFDICGIDELVEAAVDGYCCTVFAFGQTGSGKTFTIIGPSMAGLQEAAVAAAGSSRATPGSLQVAETPPAAAAGECVSRSEPRISTDSAGGMQQQEQPGSRISSFKAPTRQAGQQQQQQLTDDEGLLARCVAHLYSSIAERQQEVSCRVLASCCEIYNEAVTDLLARNKQQQLQVHQDSNTEAFYVEGLTQKEATDQHMALTLVAGALNFRHTRAHQLNSCSSRSHCLITITVASQALQQGSRGGTRRVGKLVLVDLAGSERLKDTGNSAKDAVRETGAINKSLFTLGQVLAALSVRGGCGVTGHVPYRDSRLTQLLWDGLRGGGRALMLACLSPLKAHANESLNTLHFASMALRIRSEPIIILDPQDQMVLEMRNMIKALQEDCRSLAGAISQMTSPGADIAAVLQALPPTLVQDALRCGASSAPANGQRGLRSPSRSMRGSGCSGRTRTSTGDRAKSLGQLLKPNTADASMRHSLPALLNYIQPSSSPQSPSKQHGNSSKPWQQQQQPAPWNGSPALHSINVRPNGDRILTKAPADRLLAVPGGSNRTSRSDWPAYITPPRSGGSQRSNLQCGSCEVGRGSWQGPGTGPVAYPTGNSLLGKAGMACYSGNSSTASPWLGISKYPGLAGRAAAVGTEPYAAAGVGICNSSAILPAAGSLTNPPAQATRKSAEDFPELAAMEQQFQQQLLQQATGVPPAAAPAAQHADQTATVRSSGSTGFQEAVKFAGTGSSGVLVPSGLCASIMQPRTLVPVRMSVADTEMVGTNPGASPVVVATAAADTHMRPLAVPLRPAGGAAGESRLQRSSAVWPSSSDCTSVSQGPAAAAAVADGVPEPKALHWAERNSWFGSDAEMTQLAYQAHDRLIENGVNPASDGYYAALESHVAAAFPDKWAQHLAILAATGANAAAGRSRAAQRHASPTAYVSYKMSLKPSVAAIRGSGTSAAASNAWKLSNGRTTALSPEQQQRRLQGPAAATTLSQLVQHPALTNQPAHHNSQAQLPGRAFAEEMAQLYQQHTQHQQQPQLRLLQTSDGAAGGRSSSTSTSTNNLSTQQQQQQDVVHPGSPQLTPHAMAGFPELTAWASPTPAADAGVSSASPDSPDATAAADTLGTSSSSSTAVPQDIRRSLSPTGSNTSAAVVQTQQSTQQLQVQTLPGRVISNTARVPGGVTAAAGQVLASNAPSYYSGAGPLTAGAKHSWSTSKYTQQMEAGKCLADVLWSGVSPGNKSLAELQADYRAARALVLDQLRQQKEQAELQRRQILMQIGRAINSSKWRS